MKLYRLRTVQRLPAGIDEAWAYFSDPANLARITPPWLGFKILSPLPPEAYPGMIIAYRIRPFPGVPVTWVTEISHLARPHFFVDQQRLGPYRFWHHQHHFREVDGGVEVEDVVHYALPFGPLGVLLAGGPVSRRLQEIFAFRRGVLERVFGPWPDPAPSSPPGAA